MLLKFSKSIYRDSIFWLRVSVLHYGMLMRFGHALRRLYHFNRAVMVEPASLSGISTWILCTKLLRRCVRDYATNTYIVPSPWDFRHTARFEESNTLVSKNSKSIYRDSIFWIQHTHKIMWVVIYGMLTRFGHALRRTYHCIALKCQLRESNPPTVRARPKTQYNVLASAIVEPASISGGAAKCMQKFLSHGLPIDLRLCLYQSVVCVCVL